jgi:hypothetical protein
MIEHTPAFNYYINFVLYAVTGRLCEADSLIRMYRADIGLIAHALRNLAPTRQQQLYRGVLIEPDQIKGSQLPLLHDPFTFTSFSEDPMVAAYFADTQTAISDLVIAQRPLVTGWIMTYQPTAEQILFHWSWKEVLPLAACAVMHPLIDHVQFLYSLDTQTEVIVTDRDPAGRLLREDLVDVRPYDNAYPTADLDQRFLPPAFRRPLET